MLKFKDIVLSLKNLFTMQNVYDCVRPILFMMGLLGVGASKITKMDGVYSVRNTRYSIIIAVFTSICRAWYIPRRAVDLFDGEPRPLLESVTRIIWFLTLILCRVTVTVGCIMTHVCCKDLHKVFQIINNIDVKLQQKNIKMKYRRITLAVTVLGLLIVNYDGIASNVYVLMTKHLDYMEIFMKLGLMMYNILLHLYYVLMILFQLIIYEKFVSINKLFLQNARVTNIRIVGCRNLRNDYLLRRISMARHLDVKLSEAIVIYSNVFRYIVIGLLLHPILQTLVCVIYIYFEDGVLFYLQSAYLTIFTDSMRIIILISICEAYKNERQVLAARLRHLVSHETDRRIVQQMKLYIMYNATSVTGLTDFQFTEVDNVLLFTIIDIIISNSLVIYSYAR